MEEPHEGQRSGSYPKERSTRFWRCIWVRPFDRKQTGDIDATILTDHMMLQATELGLGTVWVC